MRQRQTKKQSYSISEMAGIAVFAALTAVLAQLAIPLPNGVPVTLQTFAVALVGYTLGKEKGALTMVVYMMLGAVGLPVFANFKGGFMVLFGVTGGFLWGFIILAYFCGWGMQGKAPQKILLGVTGLLFTHALGVAQFSIVTGTAPVAAFMLVSLPFLLKDALSVGIALILAARLRRLRQFA